MSDSTGSTPEQDAYVASTFGVDPSSYSSSSGAAGDAASSQAAAAASNGADAAASSSAAANGGEQAALDSSSGGGLLGALSSAANAIGDAVGGAVSTGEQAAGDVGQAVGDAASGAVSTAGNVAADVMSGQFGQAVGDAASGAISTAGQVAGDVGQAVGDAAGTIGQAVQSGGALDFASLPTSALLPSAPSVDPETALKFAAGAVTGVAAAFTPLGVGGLMPNPKPDSKAFDLGKGLGEAAAGVGEMILGAGGEIGGLALDATGVGALVGVPANVVSAAVILQGASSAVVGASNVVHAMSMENDSSGGGSGASGDGGQDPVYSHDGQGVVWTEPQTLAEQTALQEAKSGAGDVIMEGPFNDPKYRDDRGWVKKGFLVERTADGNKIEIHYMYNQNTGAADQFKFVSRGSYKKFQPPQ